jgi:carbon-monoxide dehydrogenase small subunit
LKVNGGNVNLPNPAARLLDFLREDLGLTGAKEGCGMGECGACTVLVDGDPVCSCLVLVGQIAGADVTTVEGLSSDGRMNPIQQALVSFHASQCGFCTPGVVMSAVALLAANPDPDHEAMKEALEGNLCRCTGYAPIFRALESLRPAGV